MADQEERHGATAQMPAAHAVWQRQVSFFHPIVYRCMELPYVDAFTQRGELRLSSFSAFRKHRDEQRGDTEEGSVMAIGHDVERQRQFGVFSTFGTQAYVLSTMLYPEPHLRAELGGECFEIRDVDSFACQIGNEIGGCVGIWAGPCVYEESRVVHSAMDVAPDRFRDDSDSGKDSLGKILAAGQDVQGPRQYFLKHSRFQPQCEYRFIWHINRPASDFIDVKLPDLPRYCRKI